MSLALGDHAPPEVCVYNNPVRCARLLDDTLNYNCLVTAQKPALSASRFKKFALKLRYKLSVDQHVPNLC